MSRDDIIIIIIIIEGCLTVWLYNYLVPRERVTHNTTQTYTRAMSMCEIDI
jgi:uncharacterized membrane protein